MRTMNRRLVLGLAGATLAGATLAGRALAQPMAPGMMRGPGLGRGMNDPAAYLAGLKTDLGITPAQEPAWGEYAETVQGMATQMQAMHAGIFERMPSATPQERQDMMNGMFGSRDEAHRMVQEAAQKLLPALTPAQQAKAATSLPGLIGPAAGMGPGMGMGGGMGRGMGGGAMPPRTP